MAIISVTVLPRNNLVYRIGKATALEHHNGGDARVESIEAAGDAVTVRFENGMVEVLPAAAVSVLYAKEPDDAVDTQGGKDIQEDAERKPEAEADVRQPGKGKGGSSDSSGSRKKRRKKGAARKGAGK